MVIDPTDREAVLDLKARYFFCVDTRRWDELRTLFTDDARFDGFVAATDGPDAFVDGVASFLAGVTSVHHGSMPQLVARSADLIRARWSMVDLLTWPPGTKPLPGHDSSDLSGRRGHGYYEDEYRRTGDGWRISFMRLARVRVELLHGVHHEQAIATPPDPTWMG